MLALLLLRANQVVTVGQFADVLWPGRSPAPAPERRLRANRRNLQVRISQLRKRLAAVEPMGEVRLSFREPGYLLRVNRDELDWERFSVLAEQGRRALVEGAPDRADALLGKALGLWQGRALEDIDALADHRARLEQSRLAAIEDRLDARLSLGEQIQLSRELPDLVAEHPLRERLRGQLMVALYRCGRQAEALGVFRDTRRILIDELGIEPGRDLQRLEQAILRADPSLDIPLARATVSVGARALVAPAQLPAGIAQFTGRLDGLEGLDSLADAYLQEPSRAVICLLAGPPGIGKTTLALHWAHRAIGRFPDGQLYVDLRGFHPSGSLMSPAEGIRTLLDGLGVPPDRVPAGDDAATGLFRSLVAGRRMLILLDNARNASQVRPLLPGGQGCMTLVTSRNQLPSLISADGAHPMILDRLPRQESYQLLAARLGADRVDAEPAAVQRIVDRSVGLPLALAIMAARAAIDPSGSLEVLAADLAEVKPGLDAFDGGDLGSDLRVVFSWSYAALRADAARLFRLLGLSPGRDLTPAAIASLVGESIGDAQRWLADLTGAHLVAVPSRQRFAPHDLVGAYALELAHQVDSGSQRNRAYARLLDHYLHSASSAIELLQQGISELLLGDVLPGVTRQAFSDERSAMAWLDAERPTLIHLVESAAAMGFDNHACQLARSIDKFLGRQGRWRDRVVVHTASLVSALRLGDGAMLAAAYQALGRAHLGYGNRGESEANYVRAAELFGGQEDHVGRAGCHVGLGRLEAQQGRYSEALQHAQQALSLYRKGEDAGGEAAALNNVGWYLTQLGEHGQALHYCKLANSLFVEHGQRSGEAVSWDSMGLAYANLGEYEPAIDCYRRAIDLQRELGNRYLEADSLGHLGDTYAEVGDVGRGAQAWQQALTLFVELEHSDATIARAKLDDLDRRKPRHLS